MLQVAAEGATAEMVELLIENKANLEAENLEVKQQSFSAIKGKIYSCFKSLLKHNPNTRAQTNTEKQLFTKPFSGEIMNS